jgi:hypothetical protein
MSADSAIDPEVENAESTKPTEQQLYSQGLREIADFYDAHPEVKLPFEGTLSEFRIYGLSKAELAPTLRAFGKAEKKYTNDTFEIVKTFPSGRKLYTYNPRNSICEKKVVGTKIVPAEPEKTVVVVVPAKPEREEEIVVWDCGESLLAITADQE